MAETKKEVNVEETKTAKKASSKKATKKGITEKKAVKATKKAKKEEKVEVKPVVTEAKAKVLGLKVTPRKARLVLDLIRGKDLDEALDILNNVHKEAAPYIAKLLKSAASNATNNFSMNGDKLYVASIMASDSFKMKRFLPRAKGSASGMVKRFCNVFVTLKERN